MEKTLKKDKRRILFHVFKKTDSSIASSDNTGSTGSTADLEILQYLNNKDTSLKSLS